MNELFRRFRIYISGTEPAFFLEHRIFNISSFFITAFALVGAGLNYSIGLAPETVWISLVGALVSFCLFYVARFRNYFSVKLIFGYVLLTVIILGSLFFYNNGMNGTIIYVFLMLLNIFVLIMPPSHQYWVFGILYGSIACLLTIEYLHPDWVVPYHSREEKMLDHSTGLLYCMFFSTVIIVASRRSYYNERQKAMQQNAELTLLNEKIEKQRNVLQDRSATLEDTVRLANQRRENIEVLLNELNHRVKNNLQVVSSLLKLQAQSVTDENARQAILEARNRLKSMVLAHQQLYLDENSQQIYMPEYLQNLSQSVMQTYYGDSAAEMVKFSVEPVWLQVEKAIPVGLISNELITNCFKHAVTKDNDCRIEIKLTKSGENHLLSVSDNGAGFANAKKTRTFGLELVKSLITQLNGTYQLKLENGTSWEICFN